MARKESNGYGSGGIAFVGCILVGVALGMLYGQTAVGSVLGVGVGFIVMALIRASLGRK